MKASTLRKEFGKSNMIIVRNGEKVRTAQGPKSTFFHFDAKMCKSCNGTITQAADKEWDLFCNAAIEYIEKGEPPEMAFEADRYLATSETVCSRAYLNALRYMAKLLANHMADDRSPRSMRLCEFALGASDDCPIFVGITWDASYQEHANIWSKHPYAAHGGLVLFCDKDTAQVTAFHTSITSGPLQCAITYRLTKEESEELSASFPDYVALVGDRLGVAIRTPLSVKMLRKLGLG